MTQTDLCKKRSGFTPGKCAAFTLIELLVVIAIIAILASILFPVFAQARAKARQAACLSNMKQIGTAVMMYIQDYDEVYPPSQLSQTATGTGNPVVSWPTMIYPYVKNEAVFVCPDGETALRSVSLTVGAITNNGSYCGVTTANTRFSPPAHGDGTTQGLGLVNKLSYGRNLIPTNGWRTAGFTRGDKNGFVTTGTTLSVSEAAVEQPASTIHIMDAWTTQCDQGNSIRGIQAEIRTDHYPDLTASKVANRHSGGFTAVYGDGHAKWSKWGSTKAADWSIQAD
jgi:prepilin-type N-terminal cleavage/methylation domain-containing protein/prepilin-type processing-associated H-X9-DG protein